MKFEDYLKLRLDAIVGDTYTKGYLESILATYFGKSIEDIYNEINEAHVNISKDDLISYRNKLINDKMDIVVKTTLDSLLEEEKITNYNSDLAKNIFSKYLDSYLETYVYNFNMLNYYNRYVEMIKKRLTTIKNIINFREEDIEKYDFDYATRDSFSRFDAERLLIPFVENFTLLNSILSKSNNYSSYFRKSVPLLEEKDLLVSDDIFDDTYGRIRLSIKQRENKEKVRDNSVKTNVKSLFKKN